MSGPLCCFQSHMSKMNNGITVAGSCLPKNGEANNMGFFLGNPKRDGNSKTTDVGFDSLCDLHKCAQFLRMAGKSVFVSLIVCVTLCQAIIASSYGYASCMKEVWHRQAV